MNKNKFRKVKIAFIATFVFFAIWMMLIFSRSNNNTLYFIVFICFGCSAFYINYQIGSVGFKAVSKFLNDSNHEKISNHFNNDNINFCSSCGNKINQDDKFCGKCGKQLK